MKSRSNRLQRFLDALPDHAVVDAAVDNAVDNAAIGDAAFMFEERQQDEAAAVAGGPRL